MNKKECPPLHLVEADVKMAYDPDSKIMEITLVWHKPISVITVPITLKPYEPTNPGAADDPV